MRLRFIEMTYANRLIHLQQSSPIAFGVAAASVLVWLTFRLNARYGEHGLMKLLAARRHHRYLLNRKSLRRLLKRKGGRV